MSGVRELIEAVHQAGATIRADGPDLVIRPAELVPPDLKARLRERKPELLALLTSGAGLEASCRRVEAMGVAIRIVPKDGSGHGWWLVAESAIGLVDDGAPAYRASEWLGIVTSGLSPDEIRRLDQNAGPFKRAFGGMVERIEEHG